MTTKNKKEEESGGLQQRIEGMRKERIGRPSPSPYKFQLPSILKGLSKTFGLQ